MSELVLFLILGLLLLFVVCVLAFAHRPRARLGSQPVCQLHQVVNLPGLAFPYAERLLDISDYRLLQSNPELREIGKRLYRDRSRIGRLWLKFLQEDVKTLWHFRRFLVRNGIPAEVREEVSIALVAVFALVLLHGVRVLVACAGPFSLGYLVLGAKHQVEKASCFCADVLGRIPPARRLDIERKWLKQVAQT